MMRHFRGIACVFAIALLPLSVGRADSDAEYWFRQAERPFDDLTAAVKADSRDPSALLALGIHYLRASDEDRAIAMFERTIAVDPDLAPAHLFLASAFARKGVLFPLDPGRGGPMTLPSETETAELLSAAEREFETATALAPADPFAWVVWGNSLLERSRGNPLLMPSLDPEPILAKYRRALAIDPDYLPASQGLAQALHAYGASYRFVYAGHPAPDTLPAWVPDDVDARGATYLAEALEHFRTWRNREPDDDALYIPMIESLAGLERYAEAIEACKTVIDLFPERRIARRAFDLWGDVIGLLENEIGADRLDGDMRAERERYGARIDR